LILETQNKKCIHHSGESLMSLFPRVQGQTTSPRFCVSLGALSVGYLAVTLWLVVIMSGFFHAMKAAKLLRVPENQETDGLDLTKHGGTAYNDRQASLDARALQGAMSQFNPDRHATLDAQVLRSAANQVTPML
jgi:hypothetical protein